MKKSLAVVLSALFILAFLCSCSPKTFPGDLGDSMWRDTEGYGYLITDQEGCMNGVLYVEGTENGVSYVASYDGDTLVMKADKPFAYDNSRFMINTEIARFSVWFDGTELRLTSTDDLGFVPKGSRLVMKEMKLG